jgi:hypothetical protein
MAILHNMASLLMYRKGMALEERICNNLTGCYVIALPEVMLLMEQMAPIAERCVASLKQVGSETVSDGAANMLPFDPSCSPLARPRVVVLLLSRPTLNLCTDKSFNLLMANKCLS